MDDAGTWLDDLIARMSWADKLAQLQIGYRPDPDDAAALVRSGVGAVFWPRSAAATNALQRIAIEETTHGIPLLVGLDVVHAQRTSFPVPLASACSFDPEVARWDAEVTGREANSGGVTWTFSPMVDVSPDPRWGRIAEGFGEDPYLSGLFAAAKVAGYQGTSLGRTSVLACLKHFAGYGQPEGGRDYNSVDISMRRLRAVYLPPFKAGIDAGAATVMAAFNTINGRPCHANAWLLTALLKDEWGFDGVVVADADGVPNLLPHGVAADLPHALQQAFAAGLDVEMGANVVGPDGPLLTPADLTEARVDDAVRRVLRVKAALGLFEQPYAVASAEILGPTPASRATAKAAADRSLVLLANDGTLPLPPMPLRVLLVGPYAESTDHLGCWVQSFAAPSESLVDAVRRTCPDWAVTVMRGGSASGLDAAAQAAAVAAAAEHDVVIAAVGEPSMLSGEAASRSDLRLPGDQEELIQALAETGTPLVGVVIAGRPLAIGGWAERVPALLWAFHLGLEGPAAIADALAGVTNPAGRLAASLPRTTGQVPVTYWRENTGRPALSAAPVDLEIPDIGLVGPGDTAGRFTSRYLDTGLGPQFTFGHGLSYASFAYAEPTVEPTSLTRAQLDSGECFLVRVEVTNTGERDGDAVTMVFVRDPVATLAQPLRRLRAFRRTPVAAGQAVTETFRLGRADLECWLDDAFVVEPGAFEFHVGSTLETTAQIDVTVP